MSFRNLFLAAVLSSTMSVPAFAQNPALAAIAERSIPPHAHRLDKLLAPRVSMAQPKNPVDDPFASLLLG
jgi:hypothetical protein